MAAPATITDEIPVNTPATEKNPVGRPPNAQKSVVSAPATSETLNSADTPWYSGFQNYVRTLPPWPDDVERDFPGIYRRMADTDTQVSSSIDILVLLTVSQQVEIGPGADKDDAVGYPIAQKIAAFISANIRRLGVSMQELLYEMEEGAKVEGHKFAEIVYEMATLDPADGPQLCLKAIKPKPKSAYRVVVDEFNNPLGLLPIKPNVGITQFVAPTIKDIKDKLVPWSKFLKRINSPRNNDPRGTSELRDVYHIWWMGVQNWTLMLAGMTQFATPSVALKDAPAGSVTWANEKGDILTNAADITAEGIKIAKAYRSGSAIYLANGQELEIYQANNAVQACMDFRKLVNLEIAKAITNQTLATDQSEYQPKASSSVHQDILSLKPRHNKFQIAFMLESQLFAPLVAFNFGEEMLRYNARALIGQTQQWNLAAVGQMFAQWAANDLISPSMKIGIRAGLEIPAATAEEDQRDHDFWMAQHDPALAKPKVLAGSGNQPQGAAA
jgi:hypothetical protein